ncbi:MAG: hypothetical protein JO328_00445 [Hyphomicrobiales bacterium]|nr:hypothetical protein [Hyphomicrobiales bacterium]MBV8826331.1 hypothetical protein [Hyphomicrobiales bacterium]
MQLEEASLKARVTVLGVLGLIYYGVGNYKAFKDGVADLCKDARTYAADVCGQVIQMSHVSNKQVYRVERRLKTPGKLNRLMLQLEKLNAAEPSLTKDEMLRQLRRVKREWEAIERDLTAEDRQAVEKTLVFENLPLIQNVPTDSDHAPDLPRVATTRESVPDLFEDEYESEDVSPGKRLVYHNKIQVGVDSTLKEGTLSLGRSLIIRDESGT